MRVIVCGGRDCQNQLYVFRFLNALRPRIPISVVIEGEARGVDTHARIWAESVGVPVVKFPAQWGRYGLAAGSIRNRQMLVEGKAEHVIAFPGGSGTANMIRQAKDARIPVTLIPQPTPVDR